MANGAVIRYKKNEIRLTAIKFVSAYVFTTNQKKGLFV